MRTFTKKDYPTSQVRRFLEPGPIVLVSITAWKGKTNIMTMGWHMVMEFEPSLVGCYIWSENHSFDMIRKSRECVINVPTVDIGAKVVGIGNCSGRDVDKFDAFEFTAMPGDKVAAPLIGECSANFECKLVDRQPNPQVQPVRAGGGEGPRGAFAGLSPHHALPRRRRVHDLGREHEQVSKALQAPEPVRPFRAGTALVPKV